MMLLTLVIYMRFVLLCLHLLFYFSCIFQFVCMIVIKFETMIMEIVILDSNIKICHWVTANS